MRTEKLYFWLILQNLSFFSEFSLLDFLTYPSKLILFFYVPDYCLSFFKLLSFFIVILLGLILWLILLKLILFWPIFSYFLFCSRTKILNSETYHYFSLLSLSFWLFWTYPLENTYRKTELILRPFLILLKTRTKRLNLFSYPFENTYQNTGLIFLSFLKHVPKYWIYLLILFCLSYPFENTYRNTGFVFLSFWKHVPKYWTFRNLSFFWDLSCYSSTRFHFAVPNIFIYFVSQHFFLLSSTTYSFLLSNVY